MTARAAKRPTFDQHQREYVRVRFMAGDSFSNIGGTNPFAMFFSTDAEDCFREEVRLLKQLRRTAKKRRTR